MRVNRVVKILIYSDLIIVTAFALYGPIFAIFISQQIEGGGVKVAGLAAAVYWVTRAIVQLPISRYLDRHDGERDDFWALVGGSFLFSSVPLLYLFADQPWHVYGIQFLYGLGDSLAVPTYLAVFGRHVDQGHSAGEWGLRSTIVGVGAALAGAAGGIIADRFGFPAVLVTTSALSFAGALMLLMLYGFMKPRAKGGHALRAHATIKEHG
jgi:MFS family permease